jgi:hypothetical protein
MRSRSRRFRVTLGDLDVHRLEGLAGRSGLSFAAEASLLLVAGIRMAERRWESIDGEAPRGWPHFERIVEHPEIGL